MLRKLSLAAVAAVALGAALAPTSASAHWHGGGWGWHGGGGWHHGGWGWGGPRFYAAPRLLRLWRLLCAPAGPDPLGTPLAAGQPLLLSPTAPSRGPS